VPAFLILLGAFFLLLTVMTGLKTEEMSFLFEPSREAGGIRFDRGEEPLKYWNIFS